MLPFAAMRVLLVPDKFKGTLTARQAAEAIARGWRGARPQDELELLPMSDGGDGFGEIIGGLLGAKEMFTRAHDASGYPIDARWWWSARENTAIVESAGVIGLAMLPPGKFHPFELDTFGLGLLLGKIGRKHPGARLLVGIGGSATNDGGFGLARGLGHHFLDAQGDSVKEWINLEQCDEIDPSQDSDLFREVVIATDVQNPLLGPEGASRVYGPQKGVRPEDFPRAEAALAKLVELVRRDLGQDAAEEPGAGAAGGLGYGLRVFMQGRFEPGFEIFARLAGLREKIARADCLVTAEGAIDRQTQMGKGTGAIAKLSREAGKPCFGLAGFLPDPAGLEGMFAHAAAICPKLADMAEAKRNAGPWLERLSAQAARIFTARWGTR